MKILILATALFISFSKAFAASELGPILSKYTQAQNVQVKLKKIDKKLTLGTETTSEGLLKFEKNKIFISLSGEKKIEFYYNNDTIWLVEYPDADFDKDGKRKVAVFKKNQPVLITGLVHLFSNQKKFLQGFKVLNEKKEKDDLIVDFKPQQKNLKTFTLVVNTKERTINQVIFTDDVDTKTTLELDQLKLSKKIDPKDFQFKKLKTDEVTTE